MISLLNTLIAVGWQRMAEDEICTTKLANLIRIFCSLIKLRIPLLFAFEGSGKKKQHSHTKIKNNKKKE